MTIRNIKLPNLTSSFSGIPQIEDITDALPINPNYTWAQLTGKRDPSKLTTIVVHHTGMTKAKGCTAASHARSHINDKRDHPKGQPGIPYHLYCREGRIFQVNDLLDFTYGVAGNNGYTIHIATEGDFTQDAFTELDRLALYAAILAVKVAVPSVVNIKGHGEITPTACPAIDMNRVRNDIVTIENQLKYAQSDEHAKATAYKIANQILFLYNLAQGKNPDGTAATPGNMEWAKQMLLQLDPFMRERKLL